MTKIAKGSLANPEVRRAELMVRMRGFEEAAKQAGHVGMFYTLTYPSKFHRFTTFVPFLNVAKYSLMASALLNLTMTAAYFYSFLLTKKMN